MAHGRGALDGRLAAESEARQRAETRVHELEARLAAAHGGQAATAALQRDVEEERKLRQEAERALATMRDEVARLQVRVRFLSARAGWRLFCGKH